MNKILVLFFISLTGCVASSYNNELNKSVINGKMPSVVASDLEGKDYKLPSDFSSEKNIVVFGFAHSQQKSIDTWLPYLKTETSQRNNVSYYEIPVIDNKNLLIRSMIRNGMRTGITSSEDRQRTLTLFIDKEDFARSLNLAETSDISVVLFDKAGNVLWKTKGIFEKEKLSQLLVLLN